MYSLFLLIWRKALDHLADLSFCCLLLLFTFLVGEASGKASKVVAKHIPGSQSSLEFAGAKVGTLAGEMSKTRMVFIFKFLFLTRF